MSQGFVQPIPLPLPINNGGTGAVTTGTALTNLGLGTPSGTGNVLLQTSSSIITPSITTPSVTGIVSGTSASAGKVGEIISSTVTAGAPFAVPGWATAYAQTSIIITPGFWMVTGNNTYACTVTNGMQAVYNWQQTGTPAVQAQENMTLYDSQNFFTVIGMDIPTRFYNVTVNTTINLCVYVQQGTGSGSVSTKGSIYAVRLLCST